MARLTDAIIKKLPPPEGGNRIEYDDEIPGFGIRITAAGNRSFILNYWTRGGRERRTTIGRFPDWSTVGAREEAKRLRRLIDAGGDPLAEVEADREAATVADLIERFKSEHLPRKSPGTAVNYELVLRKHVAPALRHLKVADVTFADIDRLHRHLTKTGTVYAANRTVAVLSKMFSLAVRWGLRADNPAIGVEKNDEEQRRRYLKGDELARLIEALAKHPDRQAADIFRMLLLTGARRGEVLAMRWADLDLGTGTWSKPASSTKQREPHSVPLSAPARQLLSEIPVGGEFVFPGAGGTGHVVEIKRAWRTICKAAGITGLRIHDLRHSFASQLASGGASLPLIGALLGHANPSTTHRYAHLLDDPQRAAVEKVGALIAGKTPIEPTPLRRGR